MIVEADFLTHWKTNALEARIGDKAVHCLLALWAHCQRRKAWEFQLTPLMLAGICGFKGEPQTIWDAMIELRWIERTTDLNWFQIHDWGKVNAALIGKWAGGAKKTGAWWHPRGHVVTDRPKKSAAQTTPATIGSSSGESTGTSSASSTGGSDGIGEDWTGEDENQTPVAPLEGAHTLPMPEGASPQRLAVLKSWIDYKIRIGKPIKLASWPTVLERFATLDDPALKECIDEAISNGWNHCFPERHTPPPPIGSSPNDLQKSQKKEGAAGAQQIKKIQPADFPWLELARDMRGEDLMGTWEQQDARTRSDLRKLWSDLPPHTKTAMWELTRGGGLTNEG